MPAELAPNVPAAGLPMYAPPTDPLLGQVLAGRYLISKKLGEGGMGAVYLATHTVLEKQVALKVLHGEFARKPDLVERFMQEAKAASRIRHENVIDISDFGHTPDGLVFFAMELLRGHDLHEEIARARLAGKRMPWERSRPIFLQICAALSAAHSHGIVHRDLKPENIYLVEWLGHRDFVKLLDFGIAKLTEVTDGDRKLTRTGMLFGTPEYMSPEQARGENVDHRVDVYAMGCILYQMVTGRVPFEAENFMGILSLHLTEMPPMIPPMIYQEIGAPPGLEAIILKALAKNREDRFQTIDEMSNAIRALHGEEQVPVQRPAVPLVRGDATGARQKTQWTGQVSIPTEDDDADRRARPSGGGSKLPWIILAVILAGGVGVGAFMLTKGKKGGPSAKEPAVAPAAIDAGAATPPQPELAAVPKRVKLTITTDPAGAEIYDLTTKESIGAAPFEFEVDGSREARRYRLSLAGYIGKVIELVPDEDVPYATTLTKSAGGAATAPEVVEVVPQKGHKTAPVKPPVNGTAPGSDVGPVTSPDGDKPPMKTDKTEKPPVKTDKTDKTDKPPVKTDKTDKPPDKPPPVKTDKPPDKPPPDPGGDDDQPVIKNPFGNGG